MELNLLIKKQEKLINSLQLSNDQIVILYEILEIERKLSLSEEST